MDALTLKTSKMLISSFVPIVGGALSEAVSAAGGCLRILRSVFGVYGIAAAICIFLPSLLRTGMWYFLMNVGASVGEMLSVKAAAGLLKAGASLMGILIAVQCLYLLLILVSTTILMLAGSGIA
jgi:stage III sporulation protein AE